MRKFSCTNGAYIFNTRETKGLTVEVNPAWEELQEMRKSHLGLVMNEIIYSNDKTAEHQIILKDGDTVMFYVEVILRYEDGIGYVGVRLYCPDTELEFVRTDAERDYSLIDEIIFDINCSIGTYHINSSSRDVFQRIMNEIIDVTKENYRDRKLASYYNGRSHDLI